MGYYVRILTPSRAVPPLAAIRQGVLAVGVEHRLSCDGEPEDWRGLELTLSAGEPLCAIERNDVGDAGLGRDEVDEFLEEITDAQPTSAAAWLSAYLPTVRTIYCFQVFGGTAKPGGWDLVQAAKNAIWGVTGGVMQADLEGFSNEDGYHILWQFSDHVDGSWWMAVREDDHWLRFEMDLGDRAQREAFKQGQVPPGIEAQVGGP